MIPTGIKHSDHEVVDEFNGENDSHTESFLKTNFNGYRTMKYCDREKLDYTAWIEDRDNAP
jgi:hypothetical protein